MDRRLDVDWSLVAVIIALALIGWLAIASTSGPDGAKGMRQLVWLGVGLVTFVLFSVVSYGSWKDWGPVLYGANALALLAVLLVGLKVNGSKSWLDLGWFHAQPSETMKLCTILMAARFLAAQRRDSANVSILAGLGLVIGFPLMLVALQPDFGTALTFVAMMVVYVFVFGLDWRGWAVLAVAGVVASGFMWNHVLKDYQKARIRTFLRPEDDPKGVGYHIIQSRIAIGSGGLLGQGLRAGTQSELDFLPEKDTDFIFSVIGEAWGFRGTVLVLALYGFLVSRGVRIAMEARDAFGSYLVLGIMCLLTTHVIINLGMVTGLMPTIGIPLPLVSYGGSSIVTTLAGLGLVLNVSMRRIANR